MMFSKAITIANTIIVIVKELNFLILMMDKDTLIQVNIFIVGLILLKRRLQQHHKIK